MRCIAIAGLLSVFIVPAHADTTGRATVSSVDTTELRWACISLDPLEKPAAWPQAHGDDAERAVKAGLEIVEAVNGVEAPSPLQVRVGIATGPVVVGETGAGDMARLFARPCELMRPCPFPTINLKSDLAYLPVHLWIGQGAPPEVDLSHACGLEALIGPDRGLGAGSEVFAPLWWVWWGDAGR
jgi:hypothetical protein